MAVFFLKFCWNGKIIMLVMRPILRLYVLCKYTFIFHIKKNTTSYSREIFNHVTVAFLMFVCNTWVTIFLFIFQWCRCFSIILNIYHKRCDVSKYFQRFMEIMLLFYCFATLYCGLCFFKWFCLVVKFTTNTKCNAFSKIVLTIFLPNISKKKHYEINEEFGRDINHNIRNII